MKDEAKSEKFPANFLPCLKNHEDDYQELEGVFLADDVVNSKTFEIWLKLPKKIRDDPLMKPFQIHYSDLLEASKNGHSSDELDENAFSILTSSSTIEVDLLDKGKSINTGETIKNSSILKKENTVDESEISFLPSSENLNRDVDPNLVVFQKKNDIEVEVEKNISTRIKKNSLINKVKYLANIGKISILLTLWIAFTIILIVMDEKTNNMRPTSIFNNEKKYNFIINHVSISKLSIDLQGPFVAEENSSTYIEVWIDSVTFKDSEDIHNYTEIKAAQIISSTWKLYVDMKKLYGSESEIQKHTFDLNESNISSTLSATMKSNIDKTVSLNMYYDLKPMNKMLGTIYAAAILIGLYILIIFEIVHRTFAALLCSTLSLAALAVLNQRPSMNEIVGWIDVETLLLLFSMMIMVGVLSETGIFDYMAVLAYKITRGKIWQLITCLCAFTCILASLLDNVTTILLMTPVAIRLCEVMNILPIPILILMVIFSNIGGTMTPIGDPPNVIIASNPYVIKSGVNFATFTFHMISGLKFVCSQTYFQFRLRYKNIESLKNPEAKDIKEKNYEITQWQDASNAFSNEEGKTIYNAILQKINILQSNLNRNLKSSQIDPKIYQETLTELTKKYGIQDKTLLIKCAVAIIFVISIFFLHSLPQLQRISLGWTALLGAILLLILTERQDIEIILTKIEWATLLFFTALFILMEALTKLGLIDLIGKQTEAIIMSVSENYRLAVAIVLILWVSALTSAFVDNIPLTTMMIKIAISLGNNPSLQLPLQPLMWALSFGACLGGNGSLIGASANIVCAGIAEQHGYRISFGTFFKMGFPIMVCSIAVATVYLMICHVLFHWH